MSHRTQNVVPVGSCPVTGKRSYDNRAQARAARRALACGAELNIYRCPHCDFLHLGHMPDAVRRGELDKDEWLQGSGLRPAREEDR